MSKKSTIDDGLDSGHPSYNGWQSLIIVGFVLLLGTWLLEDNLKEAGLWTEEMPSPHHTVSSNAVLTNMNTKATHIQALVDYDTLAKMSKQVQLLYEQGVLLHQTHNINNDAQLAQCVKKSRPLRAKAQAIRDKARNLGDYAYRLNMTLAADAAFSCVYCSTEAGTSCEKIPPLLEKIHHDLGKDGF